MAPRCSFRSSHNSYAYKFDCQSNKNKQSTYLINLWIASTWKKKNMSTKKYFTIINGFNINFQLFELGFYTRLRMKVWNKTMKEIISAEPY